MKLISVCRLSAAALLLGVGLILGGCAGTPEPSFRSAPPLSTNVAGGGSGLNGDAKWVFKVGDEITITFSGVNDSSMPPHVERVKDDGTITLPLIGSLRATGRTPGELQTIIHDLYVPKFYVRLTVTVKQVTQEIYYSIGGEVRQPGMRVFTTGTSVVQAIQASGDFTEWANKRKVTLTRRGGGKFTIDCKKAIENPQYDMQIQPGDAIYVPRRIW